MTSLSPCPRTIQAVLRARVVLKEAAIIRRKTPFCLKRRNVQFSALPYLTHKGVSRKEVPLQETVHRSEILIIREFASGAETDTWDSKTGSAAKVCEVRTKAGIATPGQTSAS